MPKCTHGVLVTIVMSILGGCSVADIAAPTPKETMFQLFQSPLTLPSHTAYVLAGRPSGSIAQLILLDADTWRVLRTIELPKAYTTHLSRDPLGRLWIGYEGNDWVEYRMQVYSPDGKLLNTLRPCRHPNSGVQFSAEWAFVMCKENGFFAKVAVVDLDTFRIDHLLNLEVPDNIYMIYNSGGNEQYAIALGIMYGPKDMGYTGVAFINPQSRPLQISVKILEAARAADVLNYQGKYYLLNAEGWRLADTTPNDILIVTPGDPPIIDTMATPVPSPVWGKIVDDTLFSYHNPTWSQSDNQSQQRTLTRLDLLTSTSQAWPLPDNWDANDLEFANGKIILLNDDGLYEFNPGNGQLRKQVSIPFAKQIIITP